MHNANLVPRFSQTEGLTELRDAHFSTGFYPRIYRVCRNITAYAAICLIGKCRFDYKSRYDEARQELAEGLSNGSIKRKFHVIEGGIERAPAAISLLFSGGNTGKL